jgi:hypothetical protein
MKEFYTCLALCLTALSFTCAAQTVDTNTLNRLDDIDIKIQANLLVHAINVREKTLEIESTKIRLKEAEADKSTEKSKNIAIQRALSEEVTYFQELLGERQESLNETVAAHKSRLSALDKQRAEILAGLGLEACMCEIHRIKMDEVAVPVSYGFPIRPEGYEEARLTTFRNADLPFCGGCVGGPPEKPATLKQFVCSKCAEANREWRKKIDSAIEAAEAVLAQGAEKFSPLLRAHAHNDYEHTRPLLDALDQGFCSVEADVWLVEGQLLVAHELKAVQKERTLQELYLDPLLERVKANGGRVVSNGPMVTLFIDFKSEATNTYHTLTTLLKPYKKMLTSFTADRTETNAVMIIISGNRPRALMDAEKVRYVSYDGRLDDLKSPALPHLIPMISDNWGKYFKWRGKGPLPEQEKTKLKALVDQAHAQARRIRFWNAPDTPAGWTVMLEAGVDLINTDNLAGLHDFLLTKEAGQ